MLSPQYTTRIRELPTSRISE
ncbi:MAG: DUF4113 domain-containing protein [Candidatus Moranbacteria bacterium]|nr:DUF4113 domain-containing protein [Candidatus Moranbacteria bacterium]